MTGLKRFTRILALGTVVMHLFISGASAANHQEKIDDGKAYLESVCQEMSQLRGIHGDIAIDIKTPLANLSAVTAMDVYDGAEWICKAVTDCTIITPNSQPNKVQVTQYMQKQAGQLLNYSSTGKQWIKSSVKYDDKAAMPDAKIAMQLIKAVEIKKQNEELVVLAVVVDMEEVSKFVAKSFDEIARENQADKLKNSLFTDKKMQEALDKALKNMGDISYTVTIDKSAKHVVNVYMDLTEPVQKSADGVIADMQLTDAQKAAAKLFLQDVKVYIQEDFSQFNQVKPFSVPADVVKNAVDAETYRKEMEKKAKRAA